MTDKNIARIHPHELPDALGRAPDGVKVLSLDCFDTLLWRDCYAPTDLFAGLEAVTTGQRIVGEKNARKAANALKRRNEVTLDEIYAHAMPNASEAERERAIDAELALEAQNCFAFEPTVALIRAAKARGLSVIIVSDTYLNGQQLIGLIEAAAGAEVAGLIDRVFASCDAGVSKSQGLLAKALKAMKCRTHEVMHIGDNRSADYDAARCLGIPALHLVQFADTAQNRLRLERNCQKLIGDTTGQVQGMMLHRPVIAAEEPQLSDPAEALGLTVLGPVFYGFEQWLRSEAEQLAQQRGGTVHWLFMLRDGHLPYLVHQEAGGKINAASRVEISRFVAIAASLTSPDVYQKQFALEHDLNPPTLAKQMLLEDAEIARIVGSSENEDDKAAASKRLHSELRSGQRQKLTRRRARARADRLVEHIRQKAKPQRGDTLMLVDLGYNGSAQDRIDGLLSEAFDVHVAGRYLLLREMAVSGLDKKGLIDARRFDPAFLEALCSNVAVVEQLATCELGSVIDFTDAGDPIRKENSVKGAQSAVRDRVQAGVVRFARAANANSAIRKADAQIEHGWRDAACGALTRFMFLPDRAELAVLKSFEHDVNLGSERMVGLFDPDHAREGLRRRGLFYMKGSSRMFLPAELAGEDMSTRLSLFVQQRFGLGLSYTDGAPDPIVLPAVFMSGTGSARSSIAARPTHDGFFTARLPLSQEVQAVALQVGSAFEWFELASITVSPIGTLAGGSMNDLSPRPCTAEFDHITAHSPGILECTDPAALVLVDAPESQDMAQAQMIEIVMRPLRFRPASRPVSPPKLALVKESAA